MNANDTRYVNTIHPIEKLAITVALVAAGVSLDDLYRALDSRVCDLADTIDLASIEF